MGYYANSIEGVITIPESELNETLNTIVEAYKKHNESESKYWELDIPTSIAEALNTAGFEYENEDGELVITSFDAKWHGYLDTALIPALLAHANSDSSMAFKGEDGEMWRFAKGVVGAQTATILWS